MFIPESNANDLMLRKDIVEAIETETGSEPLGFGAAEKFHQPIRVVGEDAVDAETEEALHFFDIIDRPDENTDIVFV